MGGYSKIKAIIIPDTNKNTAKNIAHPASSASPPTATTDLPVEHQHQQPVGSSDPDNNESVDLAATGRQSKRVRAVAMSATDGLTNSDKSKFAAEEEAANKLGNGGCREMSNMMRRNSSTTSYRFMRFDHKQQQGNNSNDAMESKGLSTFQGGAAAIRRAFSMRRSSSVSERYSRIYDRSATLAALDDEDDDAAAVEESTDGSSKKDKKHADAVAGNTSKRNGKIFRAWKRIFGL